MFLKVKCFEFLSSFFKSFLESITFFPVTSLASQIFTSLTIILHVHYVMQGTGFSISFEMAIRAN